MSMYSTAHVRLPLGNIGSNRWIPVSQTQHLQSDCTETFYPGQEFIRILLGSWYPSLVPQLLCTRAGGKRLPGIVLLYSWEQDSTLWPDTCNDFYLTFQAIVKICLSYRMILLTLKYNCAHQNSFCLYDLVINKWSCTIKLFEPWWCLIFGHGRCNAVQNHW